MTKFAMMLVLVAAFSVKAGASQSGHHQAEEKAEDVVDEAQTKEENHENKQ